MITKERLLKDLKEFSRDDLINLVFHLMKTKGLKDANKVR